MNYLKLAKFKPLLSHFSAPFWVDIRPNIRPNIRSETAEYSVSADTNFSPIGRSLYVMLVLGATLSDLEGREREPKTSLWNQSQIRFAAVLERRCSLLQHLSRLQMMCLLGSVEQHHFGSPSRRSFRLFLIT